MLKAPPELTLPTVSVSCRRKRVVGQPQAPLSEQVPHNRVRLTDRALTNRPESDRDVVRGQQLLKRVEVVAVGQNQVNAKLATPRRERINDFGRNERGLLRRAQLGHVDDRNQAIGITRKQITNALESPRNAKSAPANVAPGSGLIVSPR